jgi:hypothetical protein
MLNDDVASGVGGIHRLQDGKDLADLPDASIVL